MKTTPQVPSNHYERPSFRSKARFISYWHQINVIEKSKCKAVLEIGPGSNFVKRELQHLLNVAVIAVDIDIDLSPEVVADALHLPFETNSFCGAVAFQVLEHMPFERFVPVLKEMKRISRQHVILSLPDRSPFYYLSIDTPILPPLSIQWSPPLPVGTRPDNPTHYWEIGLRGYPLRRIVHAVEDSGLAIQDTFRVFEHPYHRFFLLEG